VLLQLQHHRSQLGTVLLAMMRMSVTMHMMADRVQHTASSFSCGFAVHDPLHPVIWTARFCQVLHCQRDVTVRPAATMFTYFDPITQAEQTPLLVRQCGVSQLLTQEVSAASVLCSWQQHYRAAACCMVWNDFPRDLVSRQCTACTKLQPAAQSASIQARMHAALRVLLMLSTAGLRT
jgi:hypothetical protein